MMLHQTQRQASSLLIMEKHIILPTYEKAKAYLLKLYNHKILKGP